MNELLLEDFATDLQSVEENTGRNGPTIVGPTIPRDLMHASSQLRPMPLLHPTPEDIHDDN